jgi:hypothetical protein
MHLIYVSPFVFEYCVYKLFKCGRIHKALEIKLFSTYLINNSSLHVIIAATTCSVLFRYNFDLCYCFILLNFCYVSDFHNYLLIEKLNVARLVYKFFTSSQPEVPSQCLQELRYRM